MRSQQNRRWGWVRWKTAPAVVLLAATIMLTGCEPIPPGAPGGSSSPEATATASVQLPTNEEALAIVEEVVPVLLASQGGFMSGNISLEVLSETATANMVEFVRDSREQGETKGHAMTGAPTGRDFRVIRVSEIHGSAHIDFYACFDRTNYLPLDADGNPLRSTESVNVVSVQGVLNDSEGAFKVEEYEPWTGEDFC